MRTSFKIKGCHQADKCRDGKCVISSEREDVRSSNLVHRRSTKTHITDKRHDLQGQRSRSQCHVTHFARFVENEMSYRNIKIGMRVAYTKSNNAHQFQGHELKVKVKVTRFTNAENIFSDVRVML